MALVWAVWLAAAAASSLHGTQGLTAVGVRTVPLAGEPSAEWLEAAHRASGGPLGFYLQTVLAECGLAGEAITVSKWVRTSREAEYERVAKPGLEIDVVFPVLREREAVAARATADALGNVFVPVVHSPGTTILVLNAWRPSTVTKAIFSWDIVNILWSSCWLSVIAGVIVWLADRHHRKSNFPEDFRNGAGIGVWWALVSLTTVGYGDRVPKSKAGRLFGMLWILIGVMLLAVLQGTVIEKLTADGESIYLRQLEKTADSIPGLRVGVVNESAQEWRMRARGARVSLYPDVRAAIRALEDPGDPLNAVAVDMMAAGIAVNRLSDTRSARPSGIIQDSLSYGFSFSGRAAARNATLHGARLGLAECVWAVSRAGPGHLDVQYHFRPYTDMAFDENKDFADRRRQQSSIHSSQLTASIVLPLVALATLLAAFLFERFYSLPRRPYQGVHLSDSEEPLGGQRQNGTITAGKARLQFLTEVGNGGRGLDGGADDDDAALLDDTDVLGNQGHRALDGDLSLASTA